MLKFLYEMKPREFHQNFENFLKLEEFTLKLYSLFGNRNQFEISILAAYASFAKIPGKYLEIGNDLIQIALKILEEDDDSNRGICKENFWSIMLDWRSLINVIESSPQLKSNRLCCNFFSRASYTDSNTSASSCLIC